VNHRIAKSWLVLAALLGVFAWCGAAYCEPAEKPETTAAPEHGAEAPHGKEGAHAADEHAHAPDYDNSHKNGTKAMLAPEEVRYDLAIYTFIVFALLMALLYKFAWGPIASGLDARESSIAKMIDDAKMASETASKQLQQYELKLAQASEEAGKIIAESRRQAEAIAASIKTEAEAAAQKERERAVAEIESAKNQALREIAQKSVSTAVDLAGKIIRREVRESDHQQLIAESLSRFSSN
jgi:F-type H+-transporting ATPase subunit b